MTQQSDDAVACLAPLDVTVLMDYWLAQLSAADQEPIEEHLLACDECGNRLREVIVLADGLRRLAQSGALRVVVDARFVERAKEAGQRVREYAPPAGGSIHCTVAADDDLLVGHLAADLTRSTRVDLSWCSLAGVELQRMADIAIRADAGGVVYQESITFAKASASNSMVARLLSVDTDGAERLIGEYAFHHTRTIDGPGEA